MRHHKFSSIGKDLTKQIYNGHVYITEERNINEIIIHCSASPQNLGHDAKDIDRWHLEKGWEGIGYHFIILPDGTIQKGRWIDYQGAHAVGHNTYSIGICRIGGHKGKHDATGEQIESIVRLCKLMKDGYKLENKDIKGHKELPNVHKECPCMNIDSIRLLI